MARNKYEKLAAKQESDRKKQARKGWAEVRKLARMARGKGPHGPSGCAGCLTGCSVMMWVAFAAVVIWIGIGLYWHTVSQN